MHQASEVLDINSNSQLSLSRTSGLSSLQPDLTLSATQLLLLKPSSSNSESSSLVLDVADLEANDPGIQGVSPKRETNPSISNAIVKSKLGSILPEQITTNFLTKTDTKAEDLNTVDIETGAFLTFQFNCM